MTTATLTLIVTIAACTAWLAWQVADIRSRLPRTRTLLWEKA
jgi:hypothetical protein